MNGRRVHWQEEVSISTLLEHEKALAELKSKLKAHENQDENKNQNRKSDGLNTPNLRLRMPISFAFVLIRNLTIRSALLILPFFLINKGTRRRKYHIFLETDKFNPCSAYQS